MTLSWSQLVEAVARNDTDLIVRRTPSVEMEYDQAPTLTREMIEREYFMRDDCYLVINPYPYDVEADHYILWMRYYVEEVEVRWLLKERFGLDERDEVVLYENPVGTRSVGHTRHWHVFLRWR